MLQIIRNLSIERIFFSIQPVLLGSFMKWSVLFLVIFLLLVMYRRLASDIRHIVLLLLIYAAVLIPLANEILPLDWFGDTALEHQGVEITKKVNTVLMPQYVGKEINELSIGGATEQPNMVGSTQAGVSWPVILFAIWVMGVIATSTGLVIGRYRVGVLKRRYYDRPSVRVEKELEKLVKELGVRRRVGLVISRMCRVPFTFRVFKPLVVLPLTSESWPQKRVRAVLLHELSHIRRGDYLTKLIARIVCSLFWFLPFLWITYSLLRREQETACDLSVLRRGIRPTEYAQHILDIAYNSIKNFTFQGSFLAQGRKKTLEKRIIHALHFNRGKIKRTEGIKMKTTRLVLVCILVVTVIAVVGSCALSRKTMAEKDFIAAWSGTWANRGLVGDNIYPQILINHSDGTMEFFKKPSNVNSGIKNMRIRLFGIPSITDKWIDREGRIWFRAATEPTPDRGYVLSFYGFIHESGDVLEIIETKGTKMLDEWNPDKWSWYHHKVYYRQ